MSFIYRFDCIIKVHLTTLVVIAIDCKGKCISSNHTMTTMTVSLSCIEKIIIKEHIIRLGVEYKTRGSREPVIAHLVKLGRVNL